MSDYIESPLPTDPLLESAAKKIVQGLVLDCRVEDRKKTTERISLKRIQRIASAFTEAPVERHYCVIGNRPKAAPLVEERSRRPSASASHLPHERESPSSLRSVAIQADPSLMDEFYVRYEKALKQIEDVRQNSAAAAPRVALFVLAQMMSFVALFALAHMLGSFVGFVLFFGCATIAYECVITARKL